MKKIHELIREITQLSTEIETNYPALYRYLDETPVSFSVKEGRNVSASDLESYLDTLREQLREHIKMHGGKPVIEN